MTSLRTPGGYDPVTLVHWLWWKLHCHEGSAEDFQRLFENVIKRAQPEFMSIRPYGNIRDRKCQDVPVLRVEIEARIVGPKRPGPKR